MTRTEQKEFFEFTLPVIIRVALSLPETSTKSLPLLEQIEQTKTNRTNYYDVTTAGGMLAILCFPVYFSKTKRPRIQKGRIYQFSNN